MAVTTCDQAAVGHQPNETVLMCRARELLSVACEHAVPTPAGPAEPQLCVHHPGGCKQRLTQVVVDTDVRFSTRAGETTPGGLDLSAQGSSVGERLHAAAIAEMTMIRRSHER